MAFQTWTFFSPSIVITSDVVMLTQERAKIWKRYQRLKGQSITLPRTQNFSRGILSRAIWRSKPLYRNLRLALMPLKIDTDL